jgi:hypothetical protein
MVSTFSSNKNFELMAFNEQVNAWGDKTNANWQINDNALGGVKTFNFNGGSHTLTTAEGQNLILNMGGNLSNGDQTVIFPNRGMWIVNNTANPNAGRNLILQGTAGSQPLYLPAGYGPSLIYCDGTNVQPLSGYPYYGYPYYPQYPYGTLVGPWQGVTDGSTAAAGMVGELKTASGSSGSSITSQAVVSIVTLPLTAGDWNIWGSASFTSQYSEGFSIVSCGVSQQNNYLGNNPTSLKTGSWYIVSGTNINSGMITTSMANSFNAYLVVQATVQAGGYSAYGTINARRMR